MSETPPPITMRRGQSKAITSQIPSAKLMTACRRVPWASVFPWRAGRHLAPTEITPTVAAELGAALARFHQVGLELSASSRRGSIYDHDHLVSRRVNAAARDEPGPGTQTEHRLCRSAKVKKGCAHGAF